LPRGVSTLQRTSLVFSQHSLRTQGTETSIPLVLAIAMSLLFSFADVNECADKRVPSHHAAGLAFVMGYVMIVPMGVSDLLCLLLGAVSYALLLPHDIEPGTKKLDPDEEDMLAEMSANRGTVTPQQDNEDFPHQQQPVGKRCRAATPTGPTSPAQALLEAEVPVPPRAAAPQKRRASAAAGAGRASADDNWRSRRAATPPWESRRQRSPEFSEEKVALSSGLSAARRVLAKAAA